LNWLVRAVIFKIIAMAVPGLCQTAAVDVGLTGRMLTRGLETDTGRAAGSVVPDGSACMPHSVLISRWH
jgi:hypothetical protein